MPYVPCPKDWKVSHLRCALLPVGGDVEMVVADVVPPDSTLGCMLMDVVAHEGGCWAGQDGAQRSRMETGDERVRVA